MRETKSIRLGRLHAALFKLGLDSFEAETLLRAERTLSRWGELECGDSNNYQSWALERDEETGKPFMVYYPHDGKSYRVKTADREAAALRRVEAIIKQHPHLWYYHQSDPRGCSLYVGRKKDVAGQDLDSVYTRGVAVCV